MLLYWQNKVLHTAITKFEPHAKTLTSPIPIGQSESTRHHNQPK